MSERRDLFAPGVPLERGVIVTGLRTVRTTRQEIERTF